MSLRCYIEAQSALAEAATASSALAQSSDQSSDQCGVLAAPEPSPAPPADALVPDAAGASSSAGLPEVSCLVMRVSAAHSGEAVQARP